MTEHSVSVVIPTRNRPTKLIRLLKSLDRLSVKPDEVTIVSDSSTKETQEVLECWASAYHDFDAIVLKQQPAKGPAVARNFGTKVSSGEIVAFTDDDCVTHPYWISNLSRGMSRDRKIVGVGGRVLPVKQDFISRYYSYYKILEPPESLDYLVSANCCYFRDEVLDVGGFEEDIRKPGGEDVALSLKLAQRNWRFDKAEDAIIYHDYRSDVRDLGKTFWNYGQGCRRVTDRYADQSPRKLRMNNFSRGGYGYGPLSPARITPRGLMNDTITEFRALKSKITPNEAIIFSGLRLIQRFAYYFGWRAG